MNDRFRFRVWNIKNKEMIYNAEIAYDGTTYRTSWQIGDNQNDGWIDCFGYYLDYDNEYAVMQCTGLKDKNGKLIYEGDIIADVNCGCVATIEYLPSAYSLMAHIRRMDYFIPLEDICYTDKEGTPFEVIGNIYENKELLEEECQK